MKNNKGFAIIETIIVVVMMTSSLLLVYSSYNSSIINEKKRVYYDDVVDIYKLNEIKNYILEYSSLEKYLNLTFENSSIDSTNMSIVRNIGIESSNLFENLVYTKSLFDFYEVDELIILKTDYETISMCTNELIKPETLSANPTDLENICMQSFQNYDYATIDYIRSLGSNTSFTNEGYILIAIFKNDSGKIYTNGESEIISTEVYTYAYTNLGGF